MQRSKLRLAPYWFVPERPDCEHSGLPDAGQRLVTMTTILLPALLTLPPELLVSMVSFQHVPQPGPAPAPCQSRLAWWTSLSGNGSYGTNAEYVLGNGGVVALRVEATSCRLDLAVAATPGVGGAVLCETCRVALPVTAGC
jgi:hypothetical protein